MRRDLSGTSSAPGRDTDQLSLRCAVALLVGLIGFGLLITVAKPALSTFLFGDVSAYLVLILALGLGIWVLTWFYMARLGAQDPGQ